MTLPPHKIYLGELNGSPLGDFRLAASDLGLVAVEWAFAQPLQLYHVKYSLSINPAPRHAAYSQKKHHSF